MSDTPRPSILLTNAESRLAIDLAGGSIAEFTLINPRSSRGDEAQTPISEVTVPPHSINPLSWAAPKPGQTNPAAFGHFLCLDRWGPPSDAEGRHGMPYHGEATHVVWKVLAAPHASAHGTEAQVQATLPLAGLSVKRTIRLAANAPAFAVREEVTNDRPLGRMFNIVQHATIAPPFLDADTLVDCNGRRGFAQGGALPNPEEPSTLWPAAIKKDGTRVDLRTLRDDPNPNVVSFAIDDAYGWITAASPNTGLLIGYVWSTKEYPWVSVWRDVQEGKPAARGLEFGSTGLHQPFPILARKGRIWDRPAFEYIDADQTITKSYLGFEHAIPRDFRGVSAITIQGQKIVVREKEGGADRGFTVNLGGLL